MSKLNYNFKSKIILNYPSICWICDFARKPASVELLKKGYCGCSYEVNKDGEYVDGVYFIESAKEVGLGWVDLRSRPFNESSGIITNYQILTNKVKSCDGFKSLI